MAVLIALLGVIAVLPSSPGRGAVAYATRDRIYLDLGEAGGLALGAELDVLRNGQPIARCRIDQLSRHHAACAATGAQIGDEVRFDAAQISAAPIPSSTVGPSRPELDAEEAERVHDGLRSEPFTMVESSASASTELRRRFDASIGAAHETFVVIGERRDFERERVDVVLHDLPLGFLGATATIDVTAFAWSRRPSDARFRPRGAAQLYVYETALYAREPDARFTAAAGRMNPWHAPGLIYVDGLQLGWRPAGTRLEVGLVGGSIPDVITLEPTIDRWLADVYWSIEQGEDHFLANEGRAGVAYTRELSAIGELESRFYLRLSRWLSASLGGRGVIDRDGPALANAELSLTIEPIESLRFTADAETRDERFELLSPSVSIVGADRASISATYSGLAAVTFGLNGGFAHMRGTDLIRGFVGPELEFPSLLGEGGDLTVGYQEALGFVPGRTVWTQLVLHPAAELALFARLSYLEDRVQNRSLQELGAYLHLDWRAYTHFRIRATLLGTIPVWDIGESGAPVGVYGQLALVAEL